MCSNITHLIHLPPSSSDKEQEALTALCTGIKNMSNTVVRFWKESNFPFETYPSTTTFITYGVDYAPEVCFQMRRRHEVNWWELNGSPFGSGHTDHFRLWHKGYAPKFDKNLISSDDTNRWDSFGLHLSDWKDTDENAPILLLVPTQAVLTSMNTYASTPSQWIEAMRQLFPDEKKFEIRYHPAVTPNQSEFHDLLEKNSYKFILTFNSASANEALAAGVPAIGNAHLTAIPSWNGISLLKKSTSTEVISACKRANRNHLFASLSKQTFSSNELAEPDIISKLLA
ncbi:MAG: hypothetical protein OXR68_01515 [Alphaproteobacteria bacterium]|nr:hypothetical protein [Alphaproteobacteria bacterium]MDD9919290.1 hypothetical protein [Alphaproteobacteria bacterium]